MATSPPSFMAPPSLLEEEEDEEDDAPTPPPSPPSPAGTFPPALRSEQRRWRLRHDLLHSRDLLRPYPQPPTLEAEAALLLPCSAPPSPPEGAPPLARGGSSTSALAAEVEEGIASSLICPITQVTAALAPCLPASLPPYLPASLPPYLPTSLPPYLPVSPPHHPILPLPLTPRICPITQELMSDPVFTMDGQVTLALALALTVTPNPL